MKATIRSATVAIFFGLLLSLPQLSLAAPSDDEGTQAAAMVVDAALVRPVMFGVTVVGAVAFVVSLPFSVLGGNVGEAAKTLVVTPAETTFWRCLGCTHNGRSHSSVEGSDTDME